jgi:hypothetical protein
MSEFEKSMIFHSSTHRTRREMEADQGVPLSENPFYRKNLLVGLRGDEELVAQRSPPSYYKWQMETIGSQVRENRQSGGQNKY